MFGAQARFHAYAVRISGESSTYVRVGDEGSTTTFHFCPRCGATVHYANQASREFVAVPAGAFAEPGFPAPSFPVYEERMHPWVGLPALMEHMP